MRLRDERRVGRRKAAEIRSKRQCINPNRCCRRYCTRTGQRLRDNVAPHGKK